MKHYIFTDYDSGDKLLFDNLDSAMEFVKEYQIDDIEEYGEVISRSRLDEISIINPSFKDWLNGKANNKTLMNTSKNSS